MIRHSILKLHLLLGAMSAFFCLIAQAAPPRLLPFQGRLTDSSGVPVADGAKVVQFKIYNAPTGGTAVWNGEVQKLTVNGGLVSTLLGSKASLEDVDFNGALYLEITVDANADNQITAADPPLLPRQSILPAVFSVEAQRARGLNWVDGNGEVQGSANWSVLFGENNDPATASIPASKVNFPVGSLPALVIAANNAITASQIAPNAVETSEIKDLAVTTAKIADSAVTSAKIANGSVGMDDLSASVISRLESIEARLAAIEAGQWTSVQDPALGSLPYSTTTEGSYDLPASIPQAAKQVLVYVWVQSGTVAIQTGAHMQVYTKQGTSRHSCLFYAQPYNQQAVAFNSSTFWLPITADRKIYAQSDRALSLNSNFSSSIRVIGYK